jgi:hypothetical protein
MQPEVGGNQASDVSGNLAIGDLVPAKNICAFIPSMITAAAAGIVLLLMAILAVLASN